MSHLVEEQLPREEDSHIVEHGPNSTGADPAQAGVNLRKTY
jgi:hypothetical protein